MGTRGAFGFIKDGVEKVTYNHSDSYPSSLGGAIFAYVSGTTFTGMVAAFNRIELVGEDDTPTDDQINTIKERCPEAINTGVASQSVRDWYCLLHGAQGNLADIAEIGFMIDRKDFLKDSLFCEWAYIINLDTSKVEVYKGFNKKDGGKGRYAALKSDDNSEYRGVALIDEVDIDFIQNATEQEIDGKIKALG